MNNTTQKGFMKGIIIFICCCFLVGCGGGGGGGGGGVDQRINDLDGATGVPVDSTFTYYFDQVINLSSVTPTSFFILPTPTTPSTSLSMSSKRAIDTTICNQASALVSAITCSTDSCTLDPNNDLDYNTNYTLCLTTDIGYSQAGSFFEGFMAQFTTEISTTVTANLVMADGTLRQLTDAPFPLNLGIQVSFPVPVDTTLAEALFSLRDGNRTVSTTRTWNAENTVLTVRPNGYLKYQTTYTVAVDAGAVTSTDNVDAFSADFTTMVLSDVNGDGFADLVANANAWDSDVVADINTGRSYLFYGDTVATGGASGADAIITGEVSDDRMQCIYSPTLNLDLNDDGYADLFCIASLAPGGAGDGRTYIFFGGPGSTPISGSLNAANADLVIQGTAAEHMVAVYVGDVNGDDRSDLVAVASGCSGNQGCVYAFYGPTFTSETTAGADVKITGEGAGDFFGAGVRLADINGDGIDDIITSAVGYNGGDPANINKGRSYIFYGRSDLASVTSAVQADAILTGLSTNDRFRVFDTDDIDGDGLKDIIAVASTYDAGSVQGAVYIFYAVTLATGSAADADVGLTGEAAGDQFGVFPYVGDVNGDGVTDVVVGADGYDDGASVNIGRIYVFLGGSGLVSGSASNADVMLTGENAGDVLTLAEVADVNGDGVDDIIAHSSAYPATDPVNQNTGRMYILFGGSGLTTGSIATADVIITGEQTNDRFSFSKILDINGDGVLDVVAVARGWQAGGSTGREYLFHGGSSLATQNASSAVVIIDGEGPGDQFGN